MRFSDVKIKCLIQCASLKEDLKEVRGKTRSSFPPFLILGTMHDGFFFYEEVKTRRRKKLERNLGMCIIISRE